MASLKVLGQCLSSVGIPTGLCVSHNHASAGVTMCVTGTLRTELVVVGGSGGENNVNNNCVGGDVTEVCRVAGCEGATALCGFGSDGFVVALPNGTLQLIRLFQPSNSNSNDNPTPISGLSSSSSAAAAFTTTTTTVFAKHPVKGCHFTSLASTISQSTATISQLMVSAAAAAGRNDSGGDAAATASSLPPPMAVTVASIFASCRDELFRIDINTTTTKATAAASAMTEKDIVQQIQTATTVTSLGRVAGAAGLPITSITAVPENPNLILIAVHSRLFLVDTVAATTAAAAAAAAVTSSSSSSAVVICPQRSWGLPTAATTTAATRIASVSVSGTWLSVGTSDGRLVVWDVRSSGNSNNASANNNGGNMNQINTAPSEIVEVVPTPLPHYSHTQQQQQPHLSSSFSSAMVGSGGGGVLNMYSMVSSAVSAASSSSTAVTSASLVGAGTVFTTDMRGCAKIYLRSNPSLPFEEIVLSPLSCGGGGGGGGGGVVTTAVNTNNCASPSLRCGSVGSRFGGNIVFATVDDLGVVSIFGEQL